MKIVDISYVNQEVILGITQLMVIFYVFTVYSDKFEVWWDV